ncbi:MAG: hypothetical protein Q9219_007011 [cf. Caloplaca sp. 3 TL-2023]
MGCRVSGANNPSELWDVLSSSKDLHQEIKRFNAAGFYSTTQGAHSGLTNVKDAYLLQDGIDKFDHSFFGISPVEAAAMDPQHRIMLEVAYETFESAGICTETLRGSNTGVFAGLSGSEYASSLLRDIDTLPKYYSTGCSVAVAANRISYQFDLRGPSMIVDTACSSSATALHLAMLALKAKDCDMALVSGGNLILNPDMFVHMSTLGFLSPSGVCHSFDLSADGYARGEGILAVLLKPLGQALDDGDPIRCIVRGSSINQDGRTNGITLPSTNAQKKNMDRVYTSSGLSFTDIQYCEAHAQGTGTAVGDPIEVAAVNHMMSQEERKQKLYIGSVKSSIGHLEAGAALASIIKVIECLERGMIPPQKHFHKANPKLDLRNIEIPTVLQPWPDQSGYPRRAAINSFGFGGANGHLALEYWPSPNVPTPWTTRPYLFKISADSLWSISKASEQYARYVASAKPDLQALAYTTLTKRSTLKKTQYIIASSHDELISQLERSSTRPIWDKTHRRHPLGFIFTGQGAQWPNMGKSLVECSEVFKGVVENCDRILHTLPDGPLWNVEDILGGSGNLYEIDMPLVSQVACTVLQVGLTEIWRSWGVLPQFVIGHSSGEIAACYAAGVYSLRDTLALAYYRGKYVQELQTSGQATGAMCSVGLGQLPCTQLLSDLPGYATVAAINSPVNCTISGDEDTIERLIAKSYHSLHMSKVGERYQQALAAIPITPLPSPASICEIFSTVTGQLLLAKDLSTAYWQKNLCSTVEFSGALKSAAKVHYSFALIEVGPHPALKTSILDTIGQGHEQDVQYFHSCHRSRPSIQSILQSAMEMLEQGIDLLCSYINGSPKELYPGSTSKTPLVIKDLPSYPWEHSTSHWGESRASQELRFRKFPRHALLGSRAFGDNPNQMLWRNRPTSEDFMSMEPSVAESKSPAFCILMVLEALRQIQVMDTRNSPSSDIRLNDLKFHSPIPLSAIEAEKLATSLSITQRADSNTLDIQLSFCQDDSDGGWTICFSGNAALISHNSTSLKLARCFTLISDNSRTEYLESLGTHDIRQFKDIRIETNQAEGYVADFYELPTPLRYYLALATVLQVPGLLTTLDAPLASYQIQRISSLLITHPGDQISPGFFRGSMERRSGLKASSELIFYDERGIAFQFEDLQVVAETAVNVRPPNQSMFFRSLTLPDITLLEDSSSMDVTLLLKLLTHKWPMCDIGVGDVTTNILDRLHMDLTAPVRNWRSQYRSVSTIGASSEHRFTMRRQDELTGGDFHVLFGTMSWVSSHLSSLKKPGMACVLLNGEHDDLCFQDSFDRITRVTGLSGDEWILGRYRSPVKHLDEMDEIPTQVISSQRINNLSCFEQPGLHVSFVDEHGRVESQKDEESLWIRPCHLVVIDCAEKSLLLNVDGQNFLSWFQPMIRNCKSVLWVSTRASYSPASGVGNGFIKTLLSEHPQIRACHMVFQDPVRIQDLLAKALKAQIWLINNYDETEILFRDSKISITRYQPDDDLSISMGLLPPRRIESPLNFDFYEIFQAPSGDIAIKADQRARSIKLDSESVCINIQASIIGHLDVLLARETVQLLYNSEEAGHFFSGEVVDSNSSSFAPVSRVVGWNPGPHCSYIYAQASTIVHQPDGMDPEEAVAHFSAYSLAVALIDGVMRPLTDETISIRIPGILGEALTNVCEDKGLTIRDSIFPNSDFTLGYDLELGFLLNSQPIKLLKLLDNGHPRHQISYYLNAKFRLETRFDVFGIHNVQQAFSHAHKRPCSTVLSRKGLSQVASYWMTAAPTSPYFSPDANYIIVGGLGGLGQHLILWMVAHGAKHVASLSRRGVNTPGAEVVVRKVFELGGTLDIRAVDACDPRAVRAHFSALRSIRPIRGCFNLTIQLADAHIAKMTQRQWESAISTKVHSSWNLHQASMEDKLDMFILFSSVSSISGNRTQANYAVANTFQNNLAEYRKSVLDLPGLSIALGPVKKLGVLADDNHLLQNFSRSGFLCHEPHDLDRILKAAVLASFTSDISIICTGLQRFKNVDGAVKSEPNQTQIFWSDWPEFGFMFDYERTTDVKDRPKNLLERIMKSTATSQSAILFSAFEKCLENVLGQVVSLDPDMPMASCGLDSLNTIACRYWFYKELHVDVSVFDILARKSVQDLLSYVLSKVREPLVSTLQNEIPQPSHVKDSLEIRPASHSQQRMWFLHKYLDDKTLNNLLLECEVAGEIDVRSFSQAWSIFVGRHQSLHSRLVQTPQGLQQLPLEDCSFPLAVVTSTPEDHIRKCSASRHAARSHVFDIESGNLVRGWLVLSSTGQTTFFLASHHVAWDRSSTKTIFHETSAIYKSIQNNEDLMRSLNPYPYQFIDYTIWQNEYLQEPHLVEEQIQYWSAKLANIPESTSLFPGSIVSKRPEVKSYNFEDVKIVFNSTTTDLIKQHAQRHTITPFMFMASILTLLTWRLTGDKVVVIGISDGDRGHSEFDDLVGFTVNMLAIRMDVKHDRVRYCDFLEDYRVTCLEAYQHRILPFDVLVQKLNVPRSTAHSQVFQIALNYQMVGAFTDCDYGDFKLTNFIHYNAKPQSDIKLDVEETSENQLHCTWTFDTALYDATSMAMVTNVFGQLVDSVLLKDPIIPICELVAAETASLNPVQSYCRQNGSSSLLEDGAIQEPFHSLFDSAVSTLVNKVAIVDVDGSITYGQLNMSTTKIAGHLRTKKLEPGSMVGVCCNPGIQMAIAIYGIVRAGLVYVPLEVNPPRERLERILLDAKIRIILTDSVDSTNSLQELETGSHFHCQVGVIEQLLMQDQITTPEIQYKTDVLSQSFCCIFTSGSTGIPKGIRIGHRQLRHQMQSYHDFLGTNECDRILLMSSIVFDMSLTSIYGTILRGATLFIADQEARFSPSRLLHLAAKWSITHCTLTTTQLKFLLRVDRTSFSQWHSLISLVVGGEKVPPWIVADFYSLELPQATLYNGYGPAEATVCSALKRILPMDQYETDIDVGQPLSPAKFYIFDEHLEPIQRGKEGELYIGGDILSDGYLNLDDLTRAAFVTESRRDISPTNSVQSVIYKTGDIARLTQKGTYQILGRIAGNRQVKIRGMRVELDEIEDAIYAVLRGLDQEKYGIGLAAVVYHAAEDMLVARLMTKNPHLEQCNHDQHLLAALLSGLKAKLPAHMVPQQVIITNDIPQTVSGKLDYKAMSKLRPVDTPVKYRTTNWDTSMPEQYVALQIVKIWQTFSIEIRLVDLFTNSTLSSLVTLILGLSSKTVLASKSSGSDLCEGKYCSPEPDSLPVARQDEKILVDWAEETRIKAPMLGAGDKVQQQLGCLEKDSSKAIAILGACTMAGSHLLFQFLKTTDLHIHCIGVDCSVEPWPSAMMRILDTLEHWGLRRHLDPSCFQRVSTYPGNLSEPTLGLSQHDMAEITTEVSAIYVMDSEVSLLKRYENLRQSNVESLQFLLSLAATSSRDTPVAIHYLSTWGVPHLQSWTDTKSSTASIVVDEVEMSHMEPSADGSLGYLKARWVCEKILCQAASFGLPVTIYRSCMCGSSQFSESPLDRGDINRRILEGILRTGLVPDFGSDQGGGMSWISADFLAESILFFSQHPNTLPNQAQFYHIVSETHVPYKQLAGILKVSYDGTALRTVELSAWFRALKSSTNPDMVIHAEALEAWTQAGWLPFQLNARSTLARLRREGIIPPATTKDFLMKHVVGSEGF